jgi:hypothetical protein
VGSPPSSLLLLLLLLLRLLIRYGIPMVEDLSPHIAVRLSALRTGSALPPEKIF